MSALEISTSISEAVAEAWGTLLSKSVALEPQGMSPRAEAELPSEGSFAKCEISFSGDINGKTLFLVGKTEALTMVGMMMSMGADDALIDSTREGELGAEELDGLKEAFNQLNSTAATVLRDKLSCTVNSELGELELLELDAAPEGFGEGDQALPMTLCLEGYDDGLLLQILDADLVSSLEADVAGGEDASEDPAGPSHSEKAVGGVDLQSIAGLKVSADLILAERSMNFENLLNLAVGSVIEFWKPCDHPADLCIQNTPVANGEVILTSNQHFGLRVLNLAPPRKIYQKGAQ